MGLMALTLETTDEKNTNDRNRILGVAAFMEASARVGKDEHRIDGVTEGSSEGTLLEIMA